MKHADTTGKVIGCAMKVHSYFGIGYPEVVYQRSLQIELTEADLHFEAALERHIYYKGVCVGSRKLDLIVEGKILIELKAISELAPACESQLLNYLKVFEIEVGLLINFGTPRLQVKRFVC
jgi:GxxExxY protein